MSNKDSLGDRMKRYESVPRNFLTRRVPAVLRLDGKAFHTFTNGMKRPFDDVLLNSMKRTTQYLCENIQGCVFGYTQSDEITLVLTDYATINTDPWFGYNVQKMTSISASMATLAFNHFFMDEVKKLGERLLEQEDTTDEDIAYYESLQGKLFKAMFDSRAFSIPKDEVCNCLIWRQQDATRNSIESVGQSKFSAAQLHKKTCNMIQEMLWKEFEINWNDFRTDYKRGSCCYRVPTTETITLQNREPITVTRNKWKIDIDIPVFTQDREFVEKWL